jgi:hypothetical protein
MFSFIANLFGGGRQLGVRGWEDVELELVRDGGEGFEGFESVPAVVAVACYDML